MGTLIQIVLIISSSIILSNLLLISGVKLNLFHILCIMCLQSQTVMNNDPKKTGTFCFTNLFNFLYKRLNY